MWPTADCPGTISPLPFLALNGVALLFQTLDVLLTRFRWWPLTSILWTAQLGALGVASSLVQTDEWMPLLRLLGQCLFTASQFAVTLELLHRGAFAPVTLPTRAVACGRPR